MINAKLIISFVINPENQAGPILIEFVIRSVSIKCALNNFFSLNIVL